MKWYKRICHIYSLADHGLYLPEVMNVSDAVVTYRIYALVESSAVAGQTYSFDIRTVTGTHSDETTNHIVDIDSAPQTMVSCSRQRILWWQTVQETCLSSHISLVTWANYVQFYPSCNNHYSYYSRISCCCHVYFE